MSMPLDPSLEPPAGAASGDGPDDGRAGSRGWWRAPLAAVAIAVPLLAGPAASASAATPARSTCPSAATGDAPVSDAEADGRDRGDQATVDRHRRRRRAGRRRIQEPAAAFAGQFVKFVVAAPDDSRVLYVTAADLGMADATLWVVPRGGPKALLKPLGDDFWVARPVWCQARPGDPGRIAYVTRGPVGGDLTGLELWVIDGDGSGDRRVLVGTRAERLRPRPVLRRPARRRCASWPAASACATSRPTAPTGASSTSTRAQGVTPPIGAPARRRPPRPAGRRAAGRAGQPCCRQAVRPDRPALGRATSCGPATRPSAPGAAR